MSREVLVCVAAGAVSAGAVSAGVAAPFVGVGWAVLVAMLVVVWAIDVTKGRR